MRADYLPALVDGRRAAGHKRSGSDARSSKSSRAKRRSLPLDRRAEAQSFPVKSLRTFTTSCPPRRGARPVTFRWIPRSDRRHPSDSTESPRYPSGRPSSYSSPVRAGGPACGPGRVEPVTTGRRARFQSTQGLLAALRGLLDAARNERGPPSTSVGAAFLERGPHRRFHGQRRAVAER